MKATFSTAFRTLLKHHSMPVSGSISLSISPTLGSTVLMDRGLGQLTRQSLTFLVERLGSHDKQTTAGTVAHQYFENTKCCSSFFI